MATTFRPRNDREVLALIQAAYNYQTRRLMHPAAALRYAIIGTILAAAGIPVPATISAVRSAQKQRELIHEGKTDACRSWHLGGLAYDLDTSSPGFEPFARLWKIFGGRDGRDFQNPDPGHLDFPLESVQITSVC